MSIVVIRRVLIVVAVACVALSAGLAVRLWFKATDQESYRASLATSIGGPFTMVDQDGGPVTQVDFLGRPMILYFGYTYCPDVCPTGLQTLSVALDQLGPDASKVWPLFVTIDPERDRPQVLKDYVSAFNPAIRGLTGSVEQVRAMAREYRVFFKKSGDAGADDYLMDHSSVFYVMDKQGRFAAHFTHETAPEAIAARLKTLL